MTFLSSLFGFDDAAKSANKALAKGQGELKSGYQDVASLYQPYTSTGTGAQGTLAALAGLSGKGAQDAAFGSFQTSPGYQFRLDQGTQAIDRSAASRGNLGSGATLKALSDYGQGMASQEYQNWLATLAGLANQGLSATGAQAGARTGLAQGLAGNYQQQGENTANAGLAGGSALTSLAGSILGGIF